MGNGRNQNTWKIIGLLVTAAVVGLGGAVSYGVFYGSSSKDIDNLHEKMKLVEPEVKENTEFRISATETLKHLDEKVGNNTEAVRENTKVQQQILIEMTK